MGCCSSRQVQEEVDMAHTASQPQPTYQQTYQGKAKKKKYMRRGNWLGFEHWANVCQIYCHFDMIGFDPIL